MGELPKRPYVRVKVMSLGEMSVGKSCLIKRYCEQKFVPRYISTIGVDFGVRVVNVDASGGSNEPREVKVNFWDLSGDPDFFDVRNEFYAGIQGAILVFDVTDRKSFAKLDAWVDEMGKFDGRPFATLVAANKADEGALRQVTELEGRKWAELRGYGYFETSAKTGQNVNEMFSSLLNSVVKAVRERERQYEGDS